ncbi:SWR1-complex protein 4 [Yarrowia sp. C11]|nr:SWR1-complex protein 4 [Yarrowia sp. E02]KAG5369518.1 SWR1-complex protein 4 [Yarrowia sp. C11]
MASSSDVRDVLDLPDVDPNDKLTQQPKRPKLAAPLMGGKRMDGMQRELFALMGENTPSVSVSKDAHTSLFKDKPQWQAKLTPWVWTPFQNQARDDNLVLSHWVRGGELTQGDQYPFAALNTQISFPELSSDDYEALKLDAPGWTLDETKYLMGLCSEWDLRWPVIHDRWEWQSDGDVVMEDDKDVKDVKEDVKEEDVEMADVKEEKEKDEKTEKEKEKTSTASASSRTVEDLKERFYNVVSAMSKQPDKYSAEGYNLTSVKFPRDMEIKRKQYLERLLARSPAEIAEEEALILKSRKLELSAAKMLQERQELLKLLDAPQPTSSVAQFQTSQGLAHLTSTLNDKSKKGGKPTKEGSVGPQVPDRGGSVEKTTKKEETKEAKKAAKEDKRAATTIAAAISKKLTTKEETAYGISYHDKLTPGVYLRSSKVTTFKPTIQTKIVAALQDIGIPPKPVMPTAKVCAKFESIQHSMSVLLETKRAADKLETEIRLLRGQKGQL